MGAAAYKIRRKFTWDDYRTWPDDERWEIIGGEAHAMSPSPTSRHQRIAVDLVTLLKRKFCKGPCEVFVAPMDVKLSEKDIVQPDVFVVCDKAQDKGTHFEGPPKLAVEILSESTTLHDRLHKSRLYARSGVQEYWIITPFPELVEVLTLDGANYRLLHVFKKEDTLASAAFPDLKIKLKEVFTMPPDPGAPRLVVREPRPRFGKK
jgi:Uma2 family endonuclease